MELVAATAGRFRVVYKFPQPCRRPDLGDELPEIVVEARLPPAVAVVP
jgi:hypothetical protein